MDKPLPSIKQTIDRHSLYAKKNLGQNFILDTDILRQIVSHARTSSDDFSKGSVIEVGGGPGGLTRAILEAGATNVITIEKDERCVKALNDIRSIYPDFLTVLSQDALTIDYSNLGTSPKRIIANLPYNISTVLFIDWLEHINDFSSLTLMFQKEVAQRIVAGSGEASYGRLSVMTGAFANAKIVMILPPEAFHPSPKVSSALVHITPLPNPPRVKFKDLEKITGIAFNQRRKMLRSSLKSLGEVEKICEYANVTSDKRAENISVDEFIKITEFLTLKDK